MRGRIQKPKPPPAASKPSNGWSTMALTLNLQPLSTSELLQRHSLLWKVILNCRSTHLLSTTIYTELLTSMTISKLTKKGCVESYFLWLKVKSQLDMSKGWIISWPFWCTMQVKWVHMLWPSYFLTNLRCRMYWKLAFQGWRRIITNSKT